MPVVIEADPGEADANSFVSETDADDYLATRLNASSWVGAATDDNCKRALIEATRELTRLLWTGSRTTTTQALAWPRTYAVNPDLPDLSLSGGIVYFDDDIIPQRVKDATCELALELIKAGTTDLIARDGNLDVQTKTVDVLSTTYFSPGMRAQGLQRFPRVMSLIGPLLDPAKTGGLEIVRS